MLAITTQNEESKVCLLASNILVECLHHRHHPFSTCRGWRKDNVRVWHDHLDEIAGNPVLDDGHFVVGTPAAGAVLAKVGTE